MLLIAEKMKELSFSMLMEVYLEGNMEKASEDWPHLPEAFGLQQAELDFYLYLKDVFFNTPGASCSVWQHNGKYISALRLEPYMDGLLLEALETKPDYRGQGYAKTLVKAVLEANPGRKIYSHIHKSNVPSIRTHLACGFRKILDHAAYIDGSVNHRASTFLYE